MTEEVTATEAPAVSEAPKEKRKYIKLSNAEFIAIANEEGTIRGTAERTGMSYSGVALKCKALKSQRKLKSSLFERQKQVKKAA